MDEGLVWTRREASDGGVEGSAVIPSTLAFEQSSPNECNLKDHIFGHEVSAKSCASTLWADFLDALNVKARNFR